MARTGGPALGVGRLALLRLRSRWIFAVAVGIGLVAAVAIAGAASLVQSVAAESSLQITLRSIGPGSLIDIANSSVDGEAAYQDFQSKASANVGRDLGDRYREQGRYADSLELYGTQLNSAPLALNVEAPIQLSYQEGLRDHVTLLAGAWPEASPPGGSYPVTVSQNAAAKQHLKPGDSLCLQVLNFPKEVVCTTVAAVWQAKAPTDLYWGLGGVRDNLLQLDAAPFFGALSDRLPDARKTTAHAVFAAALATFHATDTSRIQQGFRDLHFQYTVTQLNGDITTLADVALADLLVRSSVAQYAIQLVVVQILLVAIYYLVFIAGHSLDQQRQTFAVWRSRGWSWLGISRVLMLELAAVAALSLPIGLIAAWILAAAVTRAVYGAGTTIPPGLLVDQAMPVIGVVAIALAVLAYTVLTAAHRELLQVRRLTSRPETRPWWQWRYLDLVLALLGIPVLLLARALGQSSLRSSGLQGGDPISLLTPAVALLLIAIAALRLMPPAAAALGRLRRGLDQRLATWQLSRAPAQHSRLALLLVLAIALGIFAGAYASTESTNSVDRAAYATGADLRVSFNADTPPKIAGRLQSLRGLSAASAAWRDVGFVGHSTTDTSLLAVDPGSIQQVAWWRSDFSGQSLGTLLQRLVDRDPTGLSLPGRPATIGIWAFSTGVSSTLVARISDGGGRACDCPLGRLDQPGWQQLQAPIAIPGMRYPLKLRDLAIVADVSGKAGDIALSDLAVGAPGAPLVVVEPFAAENDFSSVAPFPNNQNLGFFHGWWKTAPVTGFTDDFLRATNQHPRDGRLTTTFRSSPGDGTVLLRPPSTVKPIPALVPAALLQAIGVGEGVQFPLSVDQFNVPVQVVGLTDHFPTLYPEKVPFMVVPRDAFLSQLGYTGHPKAWPNEAWLRVGSSAQRSDALTLRAGGAGVTQVWSRGELEAAARTDPQQLALFSNLLIGFLAALALAVVGFSVHFLVLTRGRLSDYAVLQANGMSRAQIRRSLRAEQAAVLAYSVVAGAGIGLALSWVLLPAIQVGTDISQVVPATIVSVSPSGAGGAVAVVAVAALLGGAAASRLAGRFRLIDELRLLG